MNGSTYLGQRGTQGFLHWLAAKVDEPGAFPHHYRFGRHRTEWHCDSLWDAFEKYSWAGSSFDETTRLLAKLQVEIRSAVHDGDPGEFVRASIGVLRWGGVIAHNGRTLERLGEGALRKFSAAATQLEVSTADTDRIELVEYMNAGWTKVYSLMLDDFPIYDGRVGAALGYLARLYCEDTGRSTIPTELRFAWGRAKGAYDEPRKNRNPSTGTLRLPALRPDVRQHVRCNLQAAWLLKSVAERTRFRELDPAQRVRGIEAALFMVVYELPRG